MNHSNDSIGQPPESSQGAAAPGQDEWGEPKPLRVGDLKQADYPISMLPEVIQKAVREVHHDMQAPMPLVAGCALTAVSAVVQSYVSVQRAEGLDGPVSLYTLTIAKSGERKTACDKAFTKVLRYWETQQHELAKPLRADFEARLAAWETVESVHKDTIKKAAKDGQPAEIMEIVEARLREHAVRKPVEPRVPQMLRGDDTPEALTSALKKWPTAAVISSEAGMIFGAIGMNKDNVMRNLGTLNAAWGGEPIKRGRTTQESIDIEGMRLTVGLQVQPAVLEGFMAQSGSLAKGIGYFARFLACDPESTQGTRFFREPTRDQPALNAFHQRCWSILQMPMEVDTTGRLLTTMLMLSPEAKELWAAFHDEVEEELGAGGDYFDVQDVGSKIAEQAARLAGCFHVFDAAPSYVVGKDHMLMAIQVARWYLHESLRVHRLTVVAEVVKHAEKLEQFLVRELTGKKIYMMTERALRQYGPQCIRKKDDLRAAVDVLQLHGRARWRVVGGHTSEIYLNPHVLKEYA